MVQPLTWKIIIDKLAVDFEILNQFKMIGSKLPPIYFGYHVELKVLVKEMKNYEIRSIEQWKRVEMFGNMR